MVMWWLLRWSAAFASPWTLPVLTLSVWELNTVPVSIQYKHRHSFRILPSIFLSAFSFKTTIPVYLSSISGFKPLHRNIHTYDLVLVVLFGDLFKWDPIHSAFSPCCHLSEFCLVYPIYYIWVQCSVTSLPDESNAVLFSTFAFRSSV